VTYAAAAAAAQPRGFTFSVDASGRPHSITPQGAPFAPLAGDLSAALAATQFQADRERRNCFIRFATKVVPVEQVGASDAYAAIVLGSGVRSLQLFERMFPAGSTCARPVPAPRLTAYPDFKALRNVPGQRHFSMVGFDIDPDGVPVDAKAVGGTGHAELDRASVDAVSRSRFEPGARRGCVYLIRPASDPPDPPARQACPGRRSRRSSSLPPFLLAGSKAGRLLPSTLRLGEQRGTCARSPPSRQAISDITPCRLSKERRSRPLLRDTQTA
jgi:TonB family protein